MDRSNTDSDDIEWITLIDALRGRCRWNGDKAWVDDAIQDALLQLLMTQSAGVEVQDSVGFCLHVMRCRLIDRLRKVRAHEANSLEDAPAEERIEFDWVEKLRIDGWELSPTMTALLRQIQAGVRTTKGLARVMGRDPKTIRERRAALRAFLQRVLRDPPPSAT